MTDTDFERVGQIHPEALALTPFDELSESQLEAVRSMGHWESIMQAARRVSPPNVELIEFVRHSLLDRLETQKRTSSPGYSAPTIESKIAAADDILAEIAGQQR